MYEEILNFKLSHDISGGLKFIWKGLEAGFVQ